jgi:hypothetical protein
MQSVPLECRYVPIRLHGVTFNITNHPRPNFRTHKRNYMLWFQFRCSVIMSLYITLLCVVTVCNKLAESFVLIFSFSTSIIVVLFTYIKIHSSEMRKEAINVTGMSETPFP